MKTKLLLLASIALVSVSSFGQTIKTLPFYEPFDYGTAGTDRLLESGETVSAKSGNVWWLYNQTATATSAPSIVDQPFVSAPANYPARSGNALNIVGSGDDPLVTFTEQGSDNVDLFGSFIMRIPTPTTDLFTNESGEYFFSFVKLSSSGVPNNYASNIYIKKTGTDTFNLGVAETNTLARVAWISTNYSYDVDYVVVIRYQYDSVTNTNGLSSIWVNPVISNTMPAALATTTTDVTTAPRIKNPSNALESNLKMIRINKNANANTPNIVMDEIRVGNNWNQVTGATVPLSVAKNDINGLNIYPNPVKDGKLFISSDSSELKKVAIYSVLGKQVLLKEVTSGMVDVSRLIKGVYVLKITEAGKTSTRKIAIN